MATTARSDPQQNSDMRKISAWVAIAAVPTMIAGIYGMNFDFMPELHWRFGYLLVIGGMATVAFLMFRRSSAAVAVATAACWSGQRLGPTGRASQGRRDASRTRPSAGGQHPGCQQDQHCGPEHHAIDHERHVVEFVEMYLINQAITA